MNCPYLSTVSGTADFPSLLSSGTRNRGFQSEFRRKRAKVCLPRDFVEEKASFSVRLKVK